MSVLGRGGRRARRWDPVWPVTIRPLRVLLVLVLIVTVLVLALPWLLTSYARWLMVSDPHGTADVAIVLGGGEGERLGAALRIWREGRVPALLITGPSKALLPVYTSGEDSLTQGEVKRRIAIRRGMSPDDVWIALGATSTYEEAVASRSELEARGVTRAIVVTSPIHARRARATFRSLFRDTPIEVSLETLPPGDSEERAERWWQREEETMAVLTETAKLLFYWRNYGISPFERPPRPQGRG